MGQRGGGGERGVRLERESARQPKCAGSIEEMRLAWLFSSERRAPRYTDAAA